MDINWYGLACFRIREGGVTIVCDPFDKSIGLTFPKVRADIITVSHDRPGHNAADRVAGEAKVLRGPGEYELKNTFITGLSTYHRKPKEGKAERNVAFFFEFGDLTVGHLGDIGEVPTQSEIEQLSLRDIDVLFIPVGGGDMLDPARAVEVVGMLEPKIVIPMHYRHDGIGEELTKSLEPVERFLKELGITAHDPQDTLKINKSNLPEETQVMLMNVTA